MSKMAYVRKFYAVPAKRGGRVAFEGLPGRILRADKSGHLIVQMDDGRKLILHPTYHVDYL